MCPQVGIFPWSRPMPHNHTAIGQGGALDWRTAAIGYKPFIDAREHGIIGDGVTDNRVAIQTLLDSLTTGGVVYFPPGVYLVSDDGSAVCIWIKYSGIHIIGAGREQTIFRYTAVDASEEATVIKIDKNTWNGGDSHLNIKLSGFDIDGNDMALWGFWANGFTSECFLQEVEIYNTVGWLHSEDCWYSVIKDVNCRAQYDGLPTGMDANVWDDVHNSATNAPFCLLDANSVKIDNVHLLNFGISNIPGGKAKTSQVVYLSGDVLKINNLSFEKSNDYGSKTNAFENLIKADYGSDVFIDGVYLESLYGDAIYQGGSSMRNGFEMRNIFGDSLGFALNYLFYFARHNSITVKNLNFMNSELNAEPKILHRATTYPHFTLRNIDIEEGTVVNFGGSNYSDADIQGQLGIMGTNLDTVYPEFLAVRTGLTVTNGNDGTGHYVLVEPGAFFNGFGKPVNVGTYRESPNSGLVGRVLRPEVKAATWNVCIDHYGCVFLEEVGSERRTPSQGKLILAYFTTDGAGAIAGLTSVAATWFRGSVVYDPPNLADGAGADSGAITVTGAAVGDGVIVYPPYTLQGIICTAYVNAANDVRIRLQNETGGAIDLASGTWRVKIVRII